MPRIEALSLDHQRMPAITLRRVGYKTVFAGSGEVYQIDLSSHGVDVYRALSLDDLISIRDWCNEAIAADADAPSVAAE